MHIGCIVFSTVLIGISYVSTILILRVKTPLSYLIIALSIISIVNSLTFCIVVRKKWRKKLSAIRETRRINESSANSHAMNYTNCQAPQQIANFNYVYDVQPQGVGHLDPPPLYQSIYPIFPAGEDIKQNN